MGPSNIGRAGFLPHHHFEPNEVGLSPRPRHFLAFSPGSTNRRMASERPTLLAFAQTSASLRGRGAIVPLADPRVMSPLAEPKKAFRWPTVLPEDARQYIHARNLSGSFAATGGSAEHSCDVFAVRQKASSIIGTPSHRRLFKQRPDIGAPPAKALHEKRPQPGDWLEPSVRFTECAYPGQARWARPFNAHSRPRFPSPPSRIAVGHRRPGGHRPCR